MKANLEQREVPSHSPLDNPFSGSNDRWSGGDRFASCDVLDPVRYVELFWEEA